MTETWIVNASPVILLAEAGLLNLLDRLPQEAVVPTAVADEVLAGPEQDAARRALASGWGLRRDPAVIAPSIVEWGLGAGESAVIALACQLPGAVAVLDDRLGRSAARAHDVPVLGTVGVTLRAKRAGLVASVEGAIERLQRAGLYLDAAVIDAALRLANER